MCRATLEIVVPVYNEQRVLEGNITRLHRHTRTALPELDVQITIADNASTDLTGLIAMSLADLLPGVRLRKLDQKGRGRALRSTWRASDADIVAYMDADLSTDLLGLAPLLRPLLSGEADIAIGSRLVPGAVVQRGIKREVISRIYNLMLWKLLGVHFADAQCGFKAAQRSTILPLLDRVQNQSWFFDSELLYLAETEGLTIFELPVRWRDDPDSTVKLAPTVIENLREIRRLRGARRAALRRPAAPAPAPTAARTRGRREAGAGTAP